ncbi:SHOCT domain-containing protein [Companilactobacillus halodurans]|uniref:SHOCT domain-containing protein n=1 Tax=Companilactobacillus halodurans TaxID=2584183 RepID=A0A5P0ZLT5_9LACO|nr:SHOCT domain-containing protein [Companilactobacillus halodurans]MQS75142.1 SHOCT domain-containing protein [Companilactobacillus halodurans]MQS97594.1 SHOCT domain-containing protein [Companilactobacillus halodurans]
MHALLTNQLTHQTKQVKVGFSWTEFFFGSLSPLFRGDFKWFAILFIVNILLTSFTLGFGTLIAHIAIAFFYNQWYTKDLIEKGFRPQSESDKNILLSKQYVNNNIKPFQNSSMNNNDINSIDKLKKLLDDGAITQEEFDDKKKEILNL